MKTPLWTLLLLCLCVPVRCDCQRDCLSCSHILPIEQTFNTLVCVVECQSQVSSGPTWQMCGKVMEQSALAYLSAGGTMRKRAEEEVEALAPVDQGDGGLLDRGALQRFDHVARALDMEELRGENRNAQLGHTYRQPQSLHEEEEEEEERDNEGEVESEQEGAAVNLTKRFGGFLKGKYGYRKLMDPGRPLQKRYGGFIGVRKSARKWNNQKRFSEFLKQYLGMTTRASEFNSVSTDLTQQNEV